MSGTGVNRANIWPMGWMKPATKSPRVCCDEDGAVVHILSKK
jgi:hypothetical protein